MRISDWSSDVCSSDLAQLIVLSVDLEGRKAVTPYFQKMEFRHLQPYLDKENVIPLAVKAAGLPVTLIYDAEGKEVLRVNGPLEWDGPKGKALVEEAVKGTYDGATTRSDESRVGQESVRKCSSRWSLYNSKKTT